jgi:hypothetical protein
MDTSSLAGSNDVLMRSTPAVYFQHFKSASDERFN